MTLIPRIHSAYEQYAVPLIHEYTPEEEGIEGGHTTIQADTTKPVDLTVAGETFPLPIREGLGGTAGVPLKGAKAVSWATRRHALQQGAILSLMKHR